MVLAVGVEAPVWGGASKRLQLTRRQVQCDWMARLVPWHHQAAIHEDVRAEHANHRHDIRTRHLVSSYGAHRTTVHQQKASLDGESASLVAMPDQGEKQQPDPSHRSPHESVESALREVRIQPHEVQMPQLQNDRISDRVSDS